MRAFGLARAGIAVGGEWCNWICLKPGQSPFDPCTGMMFRLPPGDMLAMGTSARVREEQSAGHLPWALEMRAVSVEEPSRLVKTLTGGILGCGGWVLSRGATDAGVVSMLFEFERQACLDIYSVLIAAGLELTHSGHLRFTELCQCTRHQPAECATEIASVDLEVHRVSCIAEAGAADAEAA